MRFIYFVIMKFLVYCRDFTVDFTPETVDRRRK